MVIKILLTYATLTLAYLKENLHEIIDKRHNNNKEQNWLNHGKDT